ncbi:MAG: hypothetical protein ACE5HO_03260 [bacterium]
MPTSCSKTFSSFLALGVLLAGLALAAGLTYGQGGVPSVESKIDKTTITIGDVVTYSIIVTRDPDVQVDIPLAANLGKFEIRDYQVHDPEKAGGKIVERTDYLISTFEVGEFEIPPLEVDYVLPGDSTKHSLKTSKLNILVKSLNPSEAGDIRDIKPPLSLPRDFSKLILWGAIGLGLLFLLSVAIYIWRRKKAGKTILPRKVEPPRPAHETAFAALNALKESSPLQEGKFKEFYVEVSQIIRSYIEGRYFIIALEMTTFELVEKLKATEIEPENIELIQALLEICDLVKFAKYSPSDSEHQSTLARAFEIVDRTKLVYHEEEMAAEAEGAPPEESEAQNTPALVNDLESES